MNRIISILCSLLFLWCGTSLAQESARFSFPQKSRTVGETIKLIEKQSDYSFFYQTGTIDLSRKVTIGADGDSIGQVLDKLFAGSAEVWSISGKQIYLKHNDQAEVASAQESKAVHRRTITGTILDAVDGQPIIGAGVLIKGTQTGAVTDPDGNFSLDVTGKKVGAATADSETTNVKTSLTKGEIGIVNVNGKSIKVAIE